jgi:hypothetical protein
VAQSLPSTVTRLFWLLLGQTLLYVAGVALVWRSRPVLDRRWRLVELAAILVIGLVLRAILIGSPPALSPDAYRYAWDPYLIAHGFSPYTHTPVDPVLTGLRDGAIWPNLRFRDAPTIYPPGAQGLFLLAYMIAPLNMLGVKAVILACDALAAVLTLALLRRHQLDLRHVILYWWAPIPILEFAYSAHIDAAAILWTLAALLVSQSRFRGARILVGVFLGLATLTKLYPLLFAGALVRRRDYGLAAGLGAPVVLGYAPFVVLGLGGGGFLSTYFSQRYVDQGLLLRIFSGIVGLVTPAVTPLLAVQALALLVLVAGVILGRLRLGLGPVEAILAFCTGWIALSPHVFPWYVAVMLPLLALVLPRRGASAAPTSWTLGVWLFVLAMPFTYVLFAPGGAAGLFIWLFIIPLAAAAVPLVTAHGRMRARHAAHVLLALPTGVGVRQLVRLVAARARASCE